MKINHIIIMSLTYNSEHLAWQQRIGQERSRSNNFYKTTGSFYKTSGTFYTSSSPMCRSPFPSANQDSAPINYKTLSYNLGFTFGGTKNIKHAKHDSPKNLADRLRNQVKDTQKKDPKKSSHLKKRHLDKYVSELQSKIAEERKKRENLEKKLKIFS
jgi:hypothetical protein